MSGGLGTRLRSVVRDIPKPMAPVAGRPFLEYLLRGLERSGVTRTVLAVGYRSEVIREAFGDRFGAVELVYSAEDTPLGTGGAIRQAAGMCRDEHALVVNGDTYFDVDYRELTERHREFGSDLTIALKAMADFDRYGTVELREKRVVGFREKQPCARGLINGGVYALRLEAILGPALPEKFSFETDFLRDRLPELSVYGLTFSGNFIDIGIPEDYEAAQTLLLEWAAP